MSEREELLNVEAFAVEEAPEDDLEAEELETDPLAGIREVLDSRIIRAIDDMGFKKLTPIQEQSIPYLLQGEDIIGQAQTGTGKTAAFGIPTLQRVDPDNKKVQAIILCPTRELAMQAAEEIRKMAKYMHGVKVLPVYGGQDINRQIIGLKGVQVIVGTPGRVMDHMRRHTIKLDDVKMVVLDEADEMLDMGFREDMELILGEIPNEHQTALFSATMPQAILDITNKFQTDAKMVKVAAQELTIPLVSQRYYRLKNTDKDAACMRLLEYYQPQLTLIFCNTKTKVDELAEVLKKSGFRAEGLHGDLSQHQRDVAMNRFKNGAANILIATDVAARGIDISNVEAVINYDIPQDIEYYVHRIGRTGRAGRTGRSFTFVTYREGYRIREIEKYCHTTIEERKLPSADKVYKKKADRYLDSAWELSESTDMELMKEYLQRKLDEEGCDAMELAAVMLKLYLGDKPEEIVADEPVRRRSSFGGRDGDRNGGRGGRYGEGRDGDRNGRRGGRYGEGRDGDRNGGRGGRYGEGRDGDRDGRRGGRGDRYVEGRDGDRDGRRGGRYGRLSQSDNSAHSYGRMSTYTADSGINVEQRSDKSSERKHDRNHPADRRGGKPERRNEGRSDKKADKRADKKYDKKVDRKFDKKSDRPVPRKVKDVNMDGSPKY